MAKIKIPYYSYPSSSEATDYSRERAVNGTLLGQVIGVCALFCVALYIFATVDLFGEHDYLSFLKFLGLVLVAFIAVFYVYGFREIHTEQEVKLILLKESNKKNPLSPEELTLSQERIKAEAKASAWSLAKKYCSFFFPSLLAVTCLTGAIKSIVMLISDGGGIIGLATSVPVLVLLTVFIFIPFLRKRRAQNELQAKQMAKHFSEKENASQESITATPAFVSEKSTPALDSPSVEKFEPEASPLERLAHASPETSILTPAKDTHTAGSDNTTPLSQTSAPTCEIPNTPFPKRIKTKGKPETPSFCRKCGQKLLPESVFCSYCGTKIITDCDKKA